MASQVGIRNDSDATIQGSDLEVSSLNTDSAGRVKVLTATASTFTHTQPTVVTATSTTILAANTARKYFLVQNNSAANILINMAGGTLTGIAPTSSNLGIVLAAGGSYLCPSNAVPRGIITAYQASGGTINTISVVEGV